MRVESIHVGTPRTLERERKPVLTSIFKEPVEGPVMVRRHNIEGDRQSDLAVHGGEYKAVYAYALEQYAWWRQTPGRELRPSHFGENLSISGATEETVCIGDLWLAGSSLLQVASPRKPCRKISRYWGRSDLLQRVHESGRIGWYLRVITEGSVEAGARISLLERPHPEWPIDRAFSAALARNRREARALSDVAALSGRWKAWLRGEPARV